MRLAAVLLCLVALSACQRQEPVAEAEDYPFQPVPFTDVHLTDAFWAPRIETNRTVTIPVCFRRCEETGRIDNFRKAAGQMEGPYEGRYYNDSDVYKVIEGAAYSLALHPDPELTQPHGGAWGHLGRRPRALPPVRRVGPGERTLAARHESPGRRP